MGCWAGSGTQGELLCQCVGQGWPERGRGWRERGAVRGSLAACARSQPCLAGGTLDKLSSPIVNAGQNPASLAGKAPPSPCAEALTTCRACPLPPLPPPGLLAQECPAHQGGAPDAAHPAGAPAPARRAGCRAGCTRSSSPFFLTPSRACFSRCRVQRVPGLGLGGGGKCPGIPWYPCAAPLRPSPTPPLPAEPLPGAAGQGRELHPAIHLRPALAGEGGRRGGRRSQGSQAAPWRSAAGCRAAYGGPPACWHRLPASWCSAACSAQRAGSGFLARCFARPSQFKAEPSEPSAPRASAEHALAPHRPPSAQAVSPFIDPVTHKKLVRSD